MADPPDSMGVTSGAEEVTFTGLRSGDDSSAGAGAGSPGMSPTEENDALSLTQ